MKNIKKEIFMKRIISLALSFFIAVGMVPVTATATAQTATNYNKEDVNWLGNSANFHSQLTGLWFRESSH